MRERRGEEERRGGEGRGGEGRGGEEGENWKDWRTRQTKWSPWIYFRHAAILDDDKVQDVALEGVAEAQ